VKQRYYVFENTGALGKGSAYSVLDRYDCHREVAWFEGMAGHLCKAQAEAECDRLNRIERFERGEA